MSHRYVMSTGHNSGDISNKFHGMLRLKCYKAVMQLKLEYGLACNNPGAVLLKTGKADEALVY